MANTNGSQEFQALTIEGNILPPEFLSSVASLEVEFQSSEDYGLSKSLGLKDEIGRFWKISNDHFDRYQSRLNRGRLKAQEIDIDGWLIPLLKNFGFEDLQPSEELVLGERSFKISHRACGERVPMLLVDGDFDLDKPYPNFGQEGRRQAAHSVLQEYLNADNDSLWGVVSNGKKLRLLRDSTSITRAAYLEADLERLFSEELYPDFVALWLAAHASRLNPRDESRTPNSCILETWRDKAHQTGERVRENLRVGVTEALRQLGNGFVSHPGNDQLRRSIADGKLAPELLFQQLLRLVYRLIFVATAEQRELLHDELATTEEKNLYASGYSLDFLGARSLRRRNYNKHSDLWQGLLISFRSLAVGQRALGIPALGGLFRDEQCPDLDKSSLCNRDLLAAIRSLMFFNTNRGVARVNYRDMNTEELGSIYESLLELQPRVNQFSSPWRFSFFGDDGSENATGSDRKSTGSYYTPASLVEELMKSAVIPVVEQTIAKSPDDPVSALLELKVVDPACGSGHFLLGAARTIAHRVACIEANSDSPDPATKRHALREVVRKCIYGVDSNPLAVELCKAALWIETIEPGKPLSFLDAHVVLGDSLIGLLGDDWRSEAFPKAAFKPLLDDDKSVCSELLKINTVKGIQELELGDYDQGAVVQDAMSNYEKLPEDSIFDVDIKRAQFSLVAREPRFTRQKSQADMFVSLYFSRKNQDTRDLIPNVSEIYEPGANTREGILDHVGKIADTYKFHHWHLVFPDVFDRVDGGFDAVLANPPWEHIKLQEKEFFSVRAPQIASARNKAERNKLIEELNSPTATQEQRNLYQEFQSAKYSAACGSRFLRNSSRYGLTGIGDVNTYAVFSETCLNLLRSSGRAGFIVPSGIATDHTTRGYFQHLVNERRLCSLYDFENRRKIFTAIDSRMKFSLLTVSGTEIESPPEFSFYLQDPQDLKDFERRIHLSVEEFELFNPNTRTCPVFRTKTDKEIALKMYRNAGVFVREARGDEIEWNPWRVSFQSMFHMSNDSNLFRTKEELEVDGWLLDGNVFRRGDESYLPLMEAKNFHQFDNRFATFEGLHEADRRTGNARAMSLAEKEDVNSVVLPRYWVHQAEVLSRLNSDKDIASGKPPVASHQWQATSGKPPVARTHEIGSLLTYRRITGATNIRTTVASHLGVVGITDSAINIIIGS